VPPAGGRDEPRAAVAEDFDVARFRQLEIAFPLVGGVQHGSHRLSGYLMNLRQGTVRFNYRVGGSPGEIRLYAAARIGKRHPDLGASRNDRPGHSANSCRAAAISAFTCGSAAPD